MSAGERGRRSSRWLVGAWVSVACIPVFLVGVSYAALTFYRETRYDTGSHYMPEWVDGMPWWVVLLEALIGVAVFSIPCLSAVVCGRRAMSDGDRRGRTPQMVGIVSLAAYVGLVAAPLVIGNG